MTPVLNQLRSSLCPAFASSYPHKTHQPTCVGRVCWLRLLYRLLNNPEGPSATATSCPKFTPLAQFRNNVAHSNMFYGLRIHPEYYPIQRPCDMFNNFQQVPAVFDGLISTKNGVKGVMATQASLADALA